MANRTYPSNAARGGATTLTGAGAVGDIFTFATVARVTVQNNTGATIYVADGVGASSAATQGDEAIAAGASYVGRDPAAWVAIYGAASTHVNGTVSGGIVVYGV